MDIQEIIDYLYSFNTHADITIEEMAEDLAIPSAEPYKGMTNGEVLKAVFSNIDFCRNEFDGSMWVDMEDIATFKLDWWNSPYEPQEISDRNLKMWHDIFEEEKRRVRSNKE